MAQSNSLKRRIADSLDNSRGVVITIVAALVVCGTIVLAGRHGLFAYLQLRAENERIVEEIVFVEEENAELTETVSKLTTDNGYIEHVAREELGMVAPDELLYQEVPR